MVAKIGWTAVAIALLAVAWVVFFKPDLGQQRTPSVPAYTKADCERMIADRNSGTRSGLPVGCAQYDTSITAVPTP